MQCCKISKLVLCQMKISKYTPPFSSQGSYLLKIFLFMTTPLLHRPGVNNKRSVRSGLRLFSWSRYLQPFCPMKLTNCFFITLRLRRKCVEGLVCVDIKMKRFRAFIPRQRKPGPGCSRCVTHLKLICHENDLLYHLTCKNLFLVFVVVEVTAFFF